MSYMYSFHIVGQIWEGYTAEHYLQAHAPRCSSSRKMVANSVCIIVPVDDMLHSLIVDSL